MLNWPKEEPTTKDMNLWKEALEDICPSRQRLTCLGQYVAKSYQVQKENIELVKIIDELKKEIETLKKIDEL